MTTPWPEDVLDCAKRLAKSLGYEDSQIRVAEGWVEVYREAEPDPIFYYLLGVWRPLDPRDPTVWSALIGFDEVPSIEVFYSGYFAANDTDGKCAMSKDIGLAVCEAYNALKGNPLGKANHSVKLYE